MTYLIYDNILRSETDEEIISNLRRKGWRDAPEKPSENAYWNNGSWTASTPSTPPIYTAEQWVGQYFTNLEVIALMRLEQAILSQGKTLGPKMEASKQWLEGMMFAQPSSSFPAAPFSYTETSVEAAETLSNN